MGQAKEKINLKSMYKIITTLLTCYVGLKLGMYIPEKYHSPNILLSLALYFTLKEKGDSK